jgi:hypothetical protein
VPMLNMDVECRIQRHLPCLSTLAAVAVFLRANSDGSSERHPVQPHYHGPPLRATCAFWLVRSHNRLVAWRFASAIMRCRMMRARRRT